MRPASSSMGRNGVGVSTASTTTGGMIHQNIDGSSCLFCHRKLLLLGKTCIRRLSIVRGNKSFRPFCKFIEPPPPPPHPSQKGKSKDTKKSPTEKDTEFLHKFTQLQFVFQYLVSISLFQIF